MFSSRVSGRQAAVRTRMGLGLAMATAVVMGGGSASTAHAESDAASIEVLASVTPTVDVQYMMFMVLPPNPEYGVLEGDPKYGVNQQWYEDEFGVRSSLAAGETWTVDTSILTRTSYAELVAKPDDVFWLFLGWSYDELAYEDHVVISLPDASFTAGVSTFEDIFTAVRDADSWHEPDDYGQAWTEDQLLRSVMTGIDHFYENFAYAHALQTPTVLSNATQTQSSLVSFSTATLAGTVSGGVQIVPEPTALAVCTAMSGLLLARRRRPGA